ILSKEQPPSIIKKVCDRTSRCPLVVEAQSYIVKASALYRESSPSFCLPPPGHLGGNLHTVLKNISAASALFQNSGHFQGMKTKTGALRTISPSVL
ncbi:MAG: hypothetical protein KKC72_00040, partial [Alphaproteobacteria bacterium]|nr:hypothetical protein [Alphaproteobacteria bacterium]